METNGFVRAKINESPIHRGEPYIAASPEIQVGLTSQQRDRFVVGQTVEVSYRDGELPIIRGAKPPIEVFGLARRETLQ